MRELSTFRRWYPPGVLEPIPNEGQVTTTWRSQQDNREKDNTKEFAMPTSCEQLEETEAAEEKVVIKLNLTKIKWVGQRVGLKAGSIY